MGSDRPGQRRWLCPILVLLAISAGMAGCSKRRTLAPLSGKVTCQGKVLRFGTVMLQPETGQPATGSIQPDGTFRMTTRGEGEGVAVGKSCVRVVCYEGQEPVSHPVPERQGEGVLGPSLIPARYLSYDTSGLVVEVHPRGNPLLLLELMDP